MWLATYPSSASRPVLVWLATWIYPEPGEPETGSGRTHRPGRHRAAEFRHFQARPRPPRVCREAAARPGASPRPGTAADAAAGARRADPVRAPGRCRARSLDRVQVADPDGTVRAADPDADPGRPARPSGHADRGRP